MVPFAMLIYLLIEMNAKNTTGIIAVSDIYWYVTLTLTLRLALTLAGGAEDRQTEVLAAH